MGSFAERFRKAVAAGTTPGELQAATGATRPPIAETATPVRERKRMIATPSATADDTGPVLSPQDAGKALLQQLGLMPADGIVRKLGETRPDVPFVFPSPQDSGYRKTLKAALVAEETRLGIWINPDDRAAEGWIAVQVQGDPNLLLLHRLPLLNRCAAPQEPF